MIYLEDPDLAPAIAQDGEEQPWIEARPGEDPLVVADHLGRPMAILRLGGRVPGNDQSNAVFLYGAPPAVVYDRPDQAKPLAPANATLPPQGALRDPSL